MLQAEITDHCSIPVTNAMSKDMHKPVEVVNAVESPPEASQAKSQTQQLYDERERVEKEQHALRNQLSTLDSEHEAKSSDQETTPNETTKPNDPKPWTQERLDQMRDTVNELVRIINKLQITSEGHERRMHLIKSIMTADYAIARLTDELTNSVWRSTELPILELEQSKEHRKFLKRELDMLYPQTCDSK